MPRHGQAWWLSFIITMRGGCDPQANKELPSDFPPVEGLLDFCYKSGTPHMLTADSKMNTSSTAALREAVSRAVPPPRPATPPMMAGSCLFSWLPALIRHLESGAGRARAEIGLHVGRHEHDF